MRTGPSRLTLPERHARRPRLGSIEERGRRYHMPSMHARNSASTCHPVRPNGANQVGSSAVVKIKPPAKGGFLVDAAGALFRTAGSGGKRLSFARGPAKALKNADYTPAQLKKMLSLLTFKFDNKGGECFFKAADDLEMIWVKKRMVPDPDRFTVAIHGNPRKVGIEQAYTADDLGTFLESPYSSWDGQNIRLTACNTGNTTNTDNPFAQQLADRLGVSVRAPNKYGVTDWDGEVFSTSILKDADGNPVTRPDGNVEIVRPPDGELIDFHPRPAA